MINSNAHPPSSKGLSWSTFLGESPSSRIALSSPETLQIQNVTIVTILLPVMSLCSNGHPCMGTPATSGSRYDGASPSSSDSPSFIPSFSHSVTSTTTKPLYMKWLRKLAR